MLVLNHNGKLLGKKSINPIMLTVLPRVCAKGTNTQPDPTGQKCICTLGYGRVGGQCSLCPKGSEVDRRTRTCQFCPVGKTSDGKGSKCTCDSGYCDPANIGLVQYFDAAGTDLVTHLGSQQCVDCNVVPCLTCRHAQDPMIKKGWDLALLSGPGWRPLP